jgi:hypothetical protein
MPRKTCIRPITSTLRLFLHSPASPSTSRTDALAAILGSHRELRGSRLRSRHCGVSFRSRIRGLDLSSPIQKREGGTVAGSEYPRSAYPTDGKSRRAEWTVSQGNYGQLRGYVV